jgi:hypothetical protein
MTIAEARSALSISQNIKHATPQKTQSNTRKIDNLCTNYGMINHTMETCRKKEYITVALIKTTQPNQKS